jgi:N-formylglutamate amidohydrolase
MVTAGMGVIYTRTSTGAALRAKPTAEEREGLLRRFYWPYHRALEREIDELIAAFGHCLILDCHSFPSHPLPCELDQDPNRPDICIGTDGAHTPETLTRAIETFFASRGLATARDRPYRGAYVPLKHWQVDSRVSAVMVEVNRKLYMHEETGVKASSFSAVKSMIADLVSCILSTSGNIFHGGED